MADITDEERRAAEKQNELAQYNAQASKNQANQLLATYDTADAQNAKLRDTQLKQINRKSEADRFEAMRNLQNSSLGLFGAMNQAMNGSAVGNLMRMLEDRNDADNSVYWQQLMDNRNQVTNAYEEAANQNEISRQTTNANLEKALRDIESEYAANLFNINPDLAEAPGTGTADFGSSQVNPASGYPARNIPLSGYIMPENAEQNVRPMRNRLLGNDYYSRLINMYNGR